MAPEILVAMTPDIRERAPEPLIYFDVIKTTRFDPREPWYPCGCPHRFDDIHVDDCWMDWLAYPKWTQDETTELPVVLDVPFTEIEKRVADSGVARSVPDTNGWCAPAETMSWCGHPLREDCGCEIDMDNGNTVVFKVDEDGTVLDVTEVDVDIDDDEGEVT